MELQRIIIVAELLQNQVMLRIIIELVVYI